jgi:tetratricopeptide (TPR) repeat protein
MTGARMAGTKPGRNQACSCGSRKKYKHCCGRATADEPAPRAPAPGEAEAHAVRGSILHQRGEWAEAADSYRRALALAPHLVEVENNLGNVLLELGRHDEAIACYRRALAIQPEDAEVHVNLGNAQRLLGHGSEAVASCGRAITLNPALPAAHNHLGLALAAVGAFEEAAASYRRALALNALHVDALVNLAAVLRDLGELRQAMSGAVRAVELEPRRAAAHLILGHVLRDIGRLDEAAASYARALSLQPDLVAALLAQGALHRLQGRADEAHASCRAALALDPDSPAALALQGELWADRGQFDEAEQAYRRVTAIDPNSPNGWSGIAASRKMRIEDGDWLQGAEALLEKRLPLRHEIRLHYSLGKYCDDVKRYERAFHHYRSANELTKRFGVRYDRARLGRRIDGIIDRFGAASMRRLQGGGNDSGRPIFIVGTARSGTSLTEQILATHPAVFGAGELDFWDRASAAYEAAGRQGRDGAPLLPRMAEDYLERLAGLSSSAQRVVDKLPANFMNVGLIHAALPRARIIHMRRHPIDACLSIYFQYFSSAHPFSNDLDDLAHYYGEYRRVTDHWHAVLPGSALLEVSYEGLIEDQEGWTRRILEFVGLPWDPRCLDFQRTGRVVTTASKWQVRQKIHASSVARWRNYERFVGPLLSLMNLDDGPRPNRLPAVRSGQA